MIAASRFVLSKTRSRAAALFTPARHGRFTTKGGRNESRDRILRRLKLPPQAARLAAAIKQEFKCVVDLIPGGNGIFEVSADGTSIFSKRQSVRFPKADEIVMALS